VGRRKQRKRRHHDDAFKLAAVKQAKESGNVAKTAEDLELSRPLLGLWIRRHAKGEPLTQARGWRKRAEKGGRPGVPIPQVQIRAIDPAVAARRSRARNAPAEDLLRLRQTIERLEQDVDLYRRMLRALLAED